MRRPWMAAVVLGVSLASMASAGAAELPAASSALAADVSGCCSWRCDWQVFFPRAGFILVYSGYWTLLAGFLVIALRGHRERSPGMPLIGLCSLLGVGLVVLPHIPPLKRWITTGCEHLFPGYASQPREYVPWWLHVLILTVIFGQHLAWGRNEAAGPLLKKHYRALCVGTLIAVFITEWLFLIFFQDYFVNEIYPTATLIVAIAYCGALVVRTARRRLPSPKASAPAPSGAPLRSRSVVGAWCLAIGTAALFIGTIVGGVANAYPGHEEFGYCLVFWMLGLCIVVLLAYAWLVTRTRRALAGATDRPSLW